MQEAGYQVDGFVADSVLATQGKILESLFKEEYGAKADAAALNLYQRDILALLPSAAVCCAQGYSDALLACSDQLTDVVFKDYPAAVSVLKAARRQELQEMTNNAVTGMNQLHHLGIFSGENKMGNSLLVTSVHEFSTKSWNNTYYLRYSGPASSRGVYKHAVSQLHDHLKEVSIHLDNELLCFSTD